MSRPVGLIRPSPATAPLAKILSPSASVPASAAPLCVTLPLEPLVAVGGSTGRVRYSEGPALAAAAPPPSLSALPTSLETLQLQQPKWQLRLTIWCTSSAAGEVFYKPTTRKNNTTQQSEKTTADGEEIWLMISGYDHFCITIFIFSLQNYGKIRPL